MSMKKIRLFGLFLAFFISSLSFSAAKERVIPPPNQAADIQIKDGLIAISYNGEQIFSGKIEPGPNRYQSRINSFQVDDRVHQVLCVYAGDWREKIKIVGRLKGSEESFPCEADRRARETLIVRNSSGLSKSLLNRAVYDRKWDWVLSFDPYSRVVIEPQLSGKESNTFSIAIEGSEVIIRFRPMFYQKHRRLRYFEPWTYRVWLRPVVGWSSWFAFFDKITEKDVIRTADVISESLLPFGYEYLQIDDGYQRGEGLPELWLEPNKKFPNGLEYLAGYIKGKGLKPGIWTNVSFKQGDFAEKHQHWFVTDKAGNIARGNWIGISLDASCPEAVNTVIKPVYRGLRQMGWEYFKVDGLRHLRYEGYNSNPDYFKAKKLDLVETYRQYVEAIREEVGRDYFVLGCWGIRPELIGLIDGCRIGTDGFSFAGLSQYNSFNNVVWRNDPDHIELNEEAYRSTAVTSLTGSLFLLTDKPEVYLTQSVEPAKRAAPVLFTLPGQIYDVDPSRSENLDRVDAEVSGSGPRIFDAGLTPRCELYLLEINRPFEYWVVLGRTGGSFDSLAMDELGLDGNKEYLVFEFWTKRFLGSFVGSFPPGNIDPVYKCQVFCLRERKNYPQLIATNRHLTCGGVDLVDVEWKTDILSGKSRIVGNDTYELFITEPEVYELEKFECDGARVVRAEKEGMLRKVSLKSETSREVVWSAKFKVR